MPTSPPPRVLLAYDFTTFLKYPGRSTIPDDALEGLWAEALDNLARAEVEFEIFEAQGARLVEVAGEYASEKLLDPAFLQRMQQELGQHGLAASVPVRGSLFLAGPDGTRALAVLTWRIHDAAPDPLSRRLLVVQDGEVVGYVDFD